MRRFIGSGSHPAPLYEYNNSAWPVPEFRGGSARSVVRDGVSHERTDTGWYVSRFSPMPVMVLVFVHVWEDGPFPYETVVNRFVQVPDTIARFLLVVFLGRVISDDELETKKPLAMVPLYKFCPGVVLSCPCPLWFVVVIVCCCCCCCFGDGLRVLIVVAEPKTLQADRHVSYRLMCRLGDSWYWFAFGLESDGELHSTQNTCRFPLL